MGHQCFWLHYHVRWMICLVPPTNQLAVSHGGRSWSTSFFFIAPSFAEYALPLLAWSRAMEHQGFSLHHLVQNFPAEGWIVSVHCQEAHVGATLGRYRKEDESIPTSFQFYLPIPYTPFVTMMAQKQCGLTMCIGFLCQFTRHRNQTKTIGTPVIQQGCWGERERCTCSQPTPGPFYKRSGDCWCVEHTQAICYNCIITAL